MKFFKTFFIGVFTIISCNSRNNIETKTTISNDTTNRINYSRIELIDESIILDSVEIMKFAVGKLKKNEANEIQNIISEDGWRILTSKELEIYHMKKILKAEKYWTKEINDDDIKEEKVGLKYDSLDFLSNMENDAQDPEEKVCILHLIRNLKNIKQEYLYNNSANIPLNHLQFSKKEKSTSILGLEVLNEDLPILYSYNDAEEEVAKLNFRLPNYNEIRLMFKYRNFIGGFKSNRDYSNYYWTTALVRGNNHHCAMDFSFDKDLDESKISYAFLDVTFSDNLSVRAVK